MRQSNSPNIDLPEARWVNKFNSGYRLCVIELVFFQSTGKRNKERIVTRLVTSPEDAKALLQNLKGTLDNYEKKYGDIASQKVE